MFFAEQRHVAEDNDERYAEKLTHGEGERRVKHLVFFDPFHGEARGEVEREDEEKQCAVAKVMPLFVFEVQGECEECETDCGFVELGWVAWFGEPATDEDDTPWDVGDAPIDLRVQEVADSHSWYDVHGSCEDAVDVLEEVGFVISSEEVCSEHAAEPSAVAGESEPDLVDAGRVIDEGARLVEEKVNEVGTDKQADDKVDG